MRKAKQNKQRDHLFKIGIKKKRKGEKNCWSVCFLEIKRNQLRSVITRPKYVTWLTICIDLITKVKSLRRKLNLFKYTLCFAFFKKIQYILRIFSQIWKQLAKCKMRSANSNPEKGLYSKKKKWPSFFSLNKFDPRALLWYGRTTNIKLLF